MLCLVCNLIKSFVGIITYINISSVKVYLKMTNIFGSCKVIVCLVVIVGGLYEICKGNFEGRPQNQQKSRKHFRQHEIFRERF